MFDTRNVATTELLANLDMLTKASLAPSSLKTYKRAWDKFNTFSVQMFGQILSPPLTVATVSLFVAFLFQHKYAARTISTYLSAISYVHKMLSLPDPTQSFVIQKIVDGAHRLTPSVDTRLPITIDVLNKLLSSLDSVISSNYDLKCFKALYLFAFSAFARIGELIITDENNLDTVIQLSDVNVQYINTKPEKIHVCFRSFKHNNGKNPKSISFSHGDAIMSAVITLIDYLHVRISSSGPLFCRQNGQPLKRTLFDSILHKNISFCGLDSSKYKGHSFRLGAATYAAEKGLTDAQIRSMGRWNSNAFQKYIRPNYS